MKWKITDPQTYLNLIGVIILLVGLGSATLIYSTAENDSKDVLGYEIIDGQAYPIYPENSNFISIPFFFFAKRLPDSYESDVHGDNR